MTKTKTKKQPKPKVEAVLDVSGGSEVPVGAEDAKMLESITAEIGALNGQLGSLVVDYEQKKAMLVGNIQQVQGKFQTLCIEIGKKLNTPVGREGQNWMYHTDIQAFRRIQ